MPNNYQHLSKHSAMLISKSIIILFIIAISARKATTVVHTYYTEKEFANSATCSGEIFVYKFILV